MPQKKAGKEMTSSAVANEPKTKPIRLDLTEAQHRKLRVMAAKDGKSMAAFCRDVIANLLESEGAEN